MEIARPRNGRALLAVDLLHALGAVEAGVEEALDALRVLRAAQAHLLRQHDVGIRHQALHRAAQQVAVQAGVGPAADFRVPGLAQLADFDLQFGRRWQAEHAPVQVLHRGAGARVGADTHGEGVDLQRRFTHAHVQVGCGGLGRVGVQRHADGFEEARLLQPLLEVQQQRFGHRRSAPGEGQVANRLRVLCRQALDLEAAQAVERAAVHHQEQAHLVLGHVHVGARAAPGGVGVTGRAQTAQRGALGRAPGRVAKARTAGQFPVLAQLRQGLRGVGLARGGAHVQFTFGLDGDAGDAGTHAGLHLQLHLVGFVVATAGCAADGYLGGEVALGLQQLAHLGRRGVDQARPLGVVHVVARHTAQPHQVQVFFQQVLQVAGRVDLDLHAQRG